MQHKVVNVTLFSNVEEKVTRKTKFSTTPVAFLSGSFHLLWIRV